MTRCGLVIVLVLALAAPAAAAGDEVFFQTPGGNIFCQTFGRHLMCGMLSTRRPNGAIPIYFLRVHGRTRVQPIVGDPDTEVPVLRYGHARRVFEGRVRCVSRRRGLRCRSRVSGHGFVLAQRRATF